LAGREIFPVESRHGRPAASETCVIRSERDRRAQLPV
jgi:hypothetical protein